ncbi:hypothetical protein [Desulfobacter postgatei]|uniref:Uncharacterized protein n=1 Tax=Desulfobacter postgatei 2ac9 TaxID=879212 RepID=I5B134_9BACT|nr:hypothetical protein [Desulfobacter postgatei]EIM63197.1 hypothetical protein DespoDRAFT_01233 [Desulfobacter postgatei 2ac9]
MLNESPFFDPESGEQYDAITIDKFSFLLPCKAFNIKYTISKSYDLALTYEFIMRFLKINGRTDIDILRQFFGFSSSEMNIELNKLLNDGYIVKDINTGMITLTNRGESLFIEDKPEIIKTENVNDTFFVELFSYNLVKSQRSSHINAFIDMKMTQVEAHEASKSKTKAKESFRKGFYQFSESKGGKEDNYRINLRKIDNITALNSFPTEIQANVELKISPSLDIELQLPKLKEFQDPSKILRVIRRSANSVSSEQKHSGKGDLQNFVNLIQDENFICSYMTRDNRFLFSNYIRDVFISQSREYEYPDTKSIIGSPLMGRNFQDIRKCVNDAEFSEETGDKINLIWLRPSYPFWGRSKESIENINLVKRDIKEDEGELFLLTDKDSAGIKGWDAKKRYQWYFDSIIVHDSIPELENIEIILIPGVFVCTLHYHSIKEAPYKIPFGLMSTNLDILKKVQSKLAEYLNDKIIVDILNYDETYQKNNFIQQVLNLLHVKE